MGSRTGIVAISALDEDASAEPWWLAIKRKLPEGVSRRAFGIGAAILIEILILLLLLTLGTGSLQSPASRSTLTTIDASDMSQAAEEQAQEQQQDPSPTAQQATDTPQPVQPPVQLTLPPTALPRPGTIPLPVPQAVPDPEPSPSPSPSPSPTSSIRAVVRSGENVGPPNTGRSGPPDTQVVGTAPDGSPLYAAQWYREPRDNEVAGYLSTARGPGWGMIACKTAPNWRVEDCVIVGESPSGSGIARATLAAAWQFQVRPPRLDGEYQVGAWVRIRMSYTNSGRR